MKPISNTLLILCLISLSIGLWQCGQRNSQVHEPSEARLRERILTAYDHFHKGRFDDFIEMRSERVRRTVFESEEEKKKGLAEWKMFLNREKPTMDLLGVEIKGNKATAKMRGSVQREDGSRSGSTLYDLWVFEKGDWFLDDANRSSPEYFPKD